MSDAQRPSAGGLLDAERIRELLGAVSGPLRRLRLRTGDTVVELEWPDQAGVPTHTGAPTAPPSGPPDGPEPAAGPRHTINSPMVGTFYRAPEPGAAPFVAVGDVVEVGQQVGIVEAMKLMNPIEADRAGRVLSVLVADGQPVEYDQPLIELEPTGPDRDPVTPTG